jgi:hypothetical protein
MQKLLLFLAILASTFTACLKEKSLEGGNNGDDNNSGNGGGAGTVSEIGTWKFINMHITNDGSIETNASGAPMATKVSTDFTTTNNSGTVAFDGKIMTFKNVTYTMEGIMKADIYISGVKTSSQDLPFTYNYPAATAAYDYKKIRTDSLYFSSSFESGISATGAIQIGPAGAKLKWNGDKMIMTMVVEENRAGTFQGMLAKIINKSTIITTLQKQ